MSPLRELTLVLAKIAGEFQNPNSSPPTFEDDEDDDISRVITSLTESLNSSGRISSDHSVLDSALSLMCIKTTEVCSVRIKIMVETLIAVLQSSVCFRVLRLGRGGPEILQVGSSISFGDCTQLMKVGADILECLEGNSGFIHALLHALLRAVVSSSIYRVPFACPSICDEGIGIMDISRRTTISRLMQFSSDKIIPSSYEMPLRLLFWHLDPLLLKNDISEVLREFMQRPFLSLKAEFYNRQTWRIMILCLATSPAMFRQTSILLHNWFLITGVTFVLELQVALVSAVIDLIYRPMMWGLSLEMGLKYPFAHAYFPSNFQKLLGLLTGPISCANFVDLVHCIKLATSAEASMDPSTCYSSHELFRHETILGSIDHNSPWSMLMKFPIWFYFASMLIFYSKNIQDLYISEVISSEDKFDSANEQNLNKSAVLFLSFILSPVDKNHGDKLAEHLRTISSSWSSACTAIFGHKEGFFVGTLASWLREFDDVCVKSWRKPFFSVSSDPKVDGNFSKKSKRLFNKIPLGILILYPGMLSDKDCELLLYYATTGEILQCGGNNTEANDSFENEISLCYVSDGRKLAIDGICLIFSVFDILEDISVMLFDCEGTMIDFICLLKVKVFKYFLRCVKTLLDLGIDQLVEIGGRVCLLDLFRRLIQWKRLGREEFEGYEQFNDVVDIFTEKFLISTELEEEI